MIEAGMNVARLNFSHGTVEDHTVRVARLRRAAKRCGKTLGLMADLQGPRFRVGMLQPEGVLLEPGSAVTLVAGRETAPAPHIPVAYPALARDVRKGGRILMDDGKVELRVLSVRSDKVRCEVVSGGLLTSRKGINLPGVDLSVPTLTAKDKKDLKTAVELGADWLAISFVRSARDVRMARRLLTKAGSDMPIMAKIERPEAIEQLSEILEEADGLLVARGDLGVELPPEQVPVLQKEVIERANRAGKTVMTATQMLDSMRFCSRPTRAETSDVANAVLDGSDSLLLTAETAAGEFPAEAIAVMHRIILEAEKSGRVRRSTPPEPPMTIADSTCLAAVRAAYDVGAGFVAAFTMSGSTAMAVSRFKPRTPILAFTPRPEVQRRMAMFWGVDPFLTPDMVGTYELMTYLDRLLLKKEMADKGEIVSVVSGYPVGVAGSTNLVTLYTVGNDKALKKVAAARQRAFRMRARKRKG
jgi:pyruvate kinase